FMGSKCCRTLSSGQCWLFATSPAWRSRRLPSVFIRRCQYWQRRMNTLGRETARTFLTHQFSSPHNTLSVPACFLSLSSAFSQVQFRQQRYTLKRGGLRSPPTVAEER